MQIGAHLLRNALFVAPMAGVTDRPFRMLARRFGAGLAVCEMVSSRPELRGSRKSLLRLDHAGETGPVSVQIAGADPAMDGRSRALQRRPRRADHRHQHGLPGEEGLQRLRRLGAARGRAAGGAHPRGGGRRGAGAGDPQDPHRARAPSAGMPCALRASPRTAGVQLLAIHGRTRACGFAGQAEYDTIAEVKSQRAHPGDRQRRHRARRPRRARCSSAPAPTA